MRQDETDPGLVRSSRPESAGGIPASAILIVGPSLAVESLTAGAGPLRTIGPEAIGRSLPDLEITAIDPAFEDDVRAVLDGGGPFTADVTSAEGRRFVRRAFPCDAGAPGRRGVGVVWLDVSHARWAQAALRHLAAELVMAEERERHRVAAVLHDEIGQALTAVRLRLANLRSGADPEPILDEVEELLGEVVGHTRSLTGELNPQALCETGLGPALRWLADEMNRRFGLSVAVSTDDAGFPLDERLRVLVFRSVAELLHNVAKHSGSDEAKVQLGPRDGHLEVTVSNRSDRHAFDVEEALSGRRKAGFGLFSIRTRLQMLGGEMEVRSISGEGTAVTLRLPAGPMGGEDQGNRN